MYSSTLSLTWALVGVGGQRQAPAASPPAETHYPLNRRLAGSQAGLNGCSKSCFHLDLIPGACSPWRVTVLKITYDMFIAKYSVVHKNGMNLFLGQNFPTTS